VFRTRNGFGREYKVQPYTNMLVRTQTMSAYNMASQQTMLAIGRRYAIFPTISAGSRPKDDPCWAWEKKRYIDLLKDPLPPASTHPNCRHIAQPVSFEQLKAERPDLFAKALAYYNSITQ
jgi:hypothetical protein